MATKSPWAGLASKGTTTKTISTSPWAGMAIQERPTVGGEAEQTFQNIFPDREYTEILNYASEKPDDFIVDIQKKGWTAETEAAIKFFVPEVSKEELQGLFGAVAPYEPEYPFKDNFLDPLQSGAVAFGQDTKTRFLTTLPSAIQDIGGALKDIGYEILSIPGKTGAFLGAIAEGKSITEASNIAQQVGEKAVEPIQITTDDVLSRILPDIQEAAEQNFRRLTSEHDAWWEEHPELVPNPKYQQNPYDNPELLKDPGYYAYSFSSSAAYSLAVMGTIMGVSAVATPAAGITAGIMVAGAPEATAMTEELLNQDLSFREAAQWGELYGLVAGGVEAASDLFLIGLASKPFRGITKPFQKMMLRLTANNIVKGIAAGTLVVGIEGIEEAITQATHNAILQQYDENVKIADGISHAFIQGTIASLPFGVFGGYASTRTFRNSLSPSTREHYDSLVAKFQKHGLSPQQAEVQATKELARTREAEISKALEITKKEYLESQGVTSEEELGTTLIAEETVTGVVPGIEFNPITTKVGKGYEIIQNGEPVGEISYTTEFPGVDGIVIDRVDIAGAARRKGLATQAIDKVLSEAEASNVPLYTGMLEPDGVQLFNALERRGVISLSPAPQRMLGEIVTRGVPQYTETTAMAEGETVSGEGIAKARYKDYQAVHDAVKSGELKIGDTTTVSAYGGQTVEIVPPKYKGELDQMGLPLKYRIKVVTPEDLTLKDFNIKPEQLGEEVISFAKQSGIELADLADMKIVDLVASVERNDFRQFAGIPDMGGRTVDWLIGKYPAWAKMENLWIKRTGEVGITKAVTPTPEVTKPVSGKEPWQMTKAEFIKAVREGRDFPQLGVKPTPLSTLREAKDYARLDEQAIRYHEGITTTALAEGKPVPAEVLKDYPDLAKVTPEVTKPTEVTPEAVKPTAPIKPTEVAPGVIRRADIIKELSERLNVPIRRGHFGGKAVGIYKRGKEIIRLKKGEVETVAHEVGHLLDDRYKISQHISKGEMPALLKEYAGKPRRKHAEAFAEYVRHYVTNPHRVKNIAPQFHKYFTEEFLASNPDIQDILDAARGDYLRWQNLPSTAKVASQLSIGEPEKFNLPHKLSELYTAAWDDLYPMQDFVKTAKKLGVEVSADENPYMLARLLRGKHGRIHTFLEQGTFGKKFWKMEKGKIAPDFTGKSLKQILAPLETKGRLDDFRIYLVARRSIRLASRGIETGIAKSDARAAITELETKFPSFKATATEIYKFQASVWQYAYESGLITGETRTKLTRTNTDYVPFYRVMEELQARGYMGKTLANIRAPVHEIKGSERLIIDPLESIVKNTYAIMDAADRNQVGIMLARLAEKDKVLAQLFEAVPTPISKVAQVNAEELGIKFPELTEKDVDMIINIFRPSLFYGKDNTLSVLINGKRKFYLVDPDLYKAIMSIEREQASLLVKILSYPAKWLRAGAVLSPDFWMLKNPLRDTMTAFAYSQYGFMPAIDTVRGLFEFMGKGEAYKMWRMSGGEHAMLVSLDRQYLRKSFKEIVKGRGLVEYVKHPLEALQAFAEFTESATRLGEFKKAIASGATPVEAGFASREVSLDFACIGAQTKSMNMITAFWNANMRAMDKLARHATQPKLAGRFYAKVLLGITLPSILLYFANRDDPRWKEIPQWQKDLFWIILTDKHIYRIPKPFELGILFGSLPERVLEYIDTTDPECIEEVLKNAGESMNPGFIPTALLPIIEGITNYNFFLGRQIVPESLENMPPELQYTVYTPEIIKEFGEWVNYSPLKIQNLLKGYTAGLGNYATDALNSILKGTGVLPDIPQPSPTLADYPVIRAIVVRDPYGSGSTSVEDFYDTLDELYKGERYLKEMLAKGEKTKFNAYKAKHPEAMLFFDYEKGEMYSASRRFLTQQSQILSDLRTKQREIYTSTDMTPEAKRTKTDELNHLITDTARLALEHLEAMPSEFSTEGVIEPLPEEAELYAVMERLPKALRNYLWENKDTIGSKQWETWENKIVVWQEADELLIDTYYEETKGQSPQDKYAYRKNHAEADAALNFWGYVTTIQSSTARRLLKERANKLGIPSVWEEKEPISPWTGATEGETESPWKGATPSPWAGMASK